MRAEHTPEVEYASMCELASELSYPEACRFLRSERGYSLREAGYLADRIAREMPDSLLGRHRAALAAARPETVKREN